MKRTKGRPPEWSWPASWEELANHTKDGPVLQRRIKPPLKKDLPSFRK